MREAATAPPDTQYRPTDGNVALRLTPVNHLNQGDVFLLINYKENEGFVPVQPRALQFTLPPRRRLAERAVAVHPTNSSRWRNTGSASGAAHRTSSRNRVKNLTTKVIAEARVIPNSLKNGNGISLPQNNLPVRFSVR